MGRAYQLFRVGSRRALETGVETVGLLLQRPALGGDGTFTAFDIAFPMGLTFLMNRHVFHLCG
jgi:hypothetical protein